MCAGYPMPNYGFAALAHENLMRYPVFPSWRVPNHERVCHVPTLRGTVVAQLSELVDFAREFFGIGT